MSTPVKVPSSAATYTPATLDPDLRTQINTLLIRDGHVTKIQDHILHSLHAHQTNWPTSIQNHALALLRSGEATTFPALLKRVLDDVRRDTLLNNSATRANANGDGKKTTSGTNGDGKKSTSGATSGSTPGLLSLAVPQTVVDEALKVTKDSLESICDVVEG